MADGIHPFQIGGITCTVIEDGSRQPIIDDLPERFPDIDPVELDAAFEQRNPSGSSHWSMNCLLLETGGRTVLIDTGLGPEGGQAYGHANERIASLVNPSDVDTVILTHAHPDHIGGLVNASGDLVYRNARYVVDINEWFHWMGPNGLITDRANQSYLLKRLDPIKERLSLIDGVAGIVPGVRALPAPGHSPGHLALLIESGNDRLLHIADTLQFDIQLDHPNWSACMDDNPEQSAQTRRAVLARAAKENILTLIYHFQFPGLGYVTKTESSYEWTPVAA